MGHSARLRIRDVKTVYQLLGEMRDLRWDLQRQADHAILTLCRVIGARQGSAIEFANWGPTGNLRVVGAQHGGWASRRMIELWEQSALMEQPRVDTIIDHATQLSGQVYARLREQIIDESAFRRSTGWALAQECGVDHQACIWFSRREPGRVSSLVFHRMVGEACFTPRQMRLLRLFAVEWRRLHLAGELDVRGCDGEPLTSRQQEILVALLRGEAPKRIAFDLGLSTHSVRTYIKALYRRLGVSGREELMARFVMNHPNAAPPEAARDPGRWTD